VKLDKFEIKENGKSVNFDVSTQVDSLKLDLSTKNPADVTKITALLGATYTKGDTTAAASLDVLADKKKYATTLSFVSSGKHTFGVSATVIPEELANPAVTIAHKTAFGDIGLASQLKFVGALADKDARLVVSAPVGAGAKLLVDSQYKGAVTVAAGLSYKWDTNGTVYAKVDQAGNKDLTYTATLGPLSTLSLSYGEKTGAINWNLELSA
jgi:hypothetical protein